MARAHFNDPIEPMTLQNMRENGVRSLDIMCHQCRHETVMNVDHLPGDLTVKSFEPRMVCTKCGTIGADAEFAFLALCPSNPDFSYPPGHARVARRAEPP